VFFCIYSEHLQYVQGRLPLTLSSDTLMANCMWEFLVVWNRDAEVTYALEQAIVYLRCVQNAALQHGTLLRVVILQTQQKHLDSEAVNM